MKNQAVQPDFPKRLFFSRSRAFTLRMAPMIDMIFLLLIFFLVAAKWRPAEDFLPLQLPAMHDQHRRLGKPEPLMIYILQTQAGCQVRIGRERTVEIENEAIGQDMALLMQEINKCLLAQRRFAGDPIEIVCSPQVKSKYWVKIYNVFYGMKLTDITFRMTE